MRRRKESGRGGQRIPEEEVALVRQTPHATPSYRHRPENTFPPISALSFSEPGFPVTSRYFRFPLAVFYSRAGLPGHPGLLMKKVGGQEEAAGGSRAEMAWGRRSVYEQLDPTSFAHLCPTRLAPLPYPACICWANARSSHLLTLVVSLQKPHDKSGKKWLFSAEVSTEVDLKWGEM